MSKAEIKKLWAERCLETGCGPWLLEEKNGVSLFMTKDPYVVKNTTFYNSPVYHIWTEDEWLTTMDYVEGYKIWENRAKERS